jgi:predicted transcriptional regulator
MALAKAEVAQRLTMRRAFNQAEAALYLGMSANKFAGMVKGKAMPSPRLAGGSKLWDIQELDNAFWELPREGEDVQVKANPWH